MLRASTAPALAALLLISAVQPGDEAEIIERILELRRQIDELVEKLSPAARERLEQRLARQRAVDSADPDTELETRENEPVPAPAAVATAEPTTTPSDRTPPTPPASLPPVAALEPAAPAPSPAPGNRVATPPDLPPPRRAGRRACNTLVLLDTNGDRDITGADRHWRHLYVWVDRDGDRDPDDREVKHLYEHDIRGLEVSLTGYVDKKGRMGDLWIDDQILVELRPGTPGGRGILVVDADGLSQGSELELLSADGEVLSGYQPLVRGLKLKHENDALIDLNCP